MEHNPFNTAISHILTPEQEQRQQQQHQQQQQQQHQQQNPSGGKKDESLFGLVNLDLGHPSSKPPQRNKSIYDSTTTDAKSAVNPFDTYATPTTSQSNTQHHQQPPANNTGFNNNNWMASGNIGMMTDQSSFMNSSQQQQYGSRGNPQAKSSLDSLNWKM
jgi:hypothetical protein